MAAYILSVEQLHPDLLLGPLKHDHKLTLIFFSYQGVSTNPWIKRGDPTVMWPRDWLPKEEEGLGDNILVLSVLCSLRGNQSWVDIGKAVLQELVMDTRWQLDRPQTIVLVGHGLGGLVLKSFTMEVDKVLKVDKANGELQKARCKAFQQNIRGIVFYSVPHTTSEVECAKYWKSYPDEHMSWRPFHFPKHFSQDTVSLNVGFEKSIEQQHINLFAFVEGQKVPISQSSTYKLTQNNVCKIEDANCIQVSQPLNQQHDSYQRLLRFIQAALDDELRLQQFNTKFNLKDSQGLDDQSTSIGLSSVVQKPHLLRKAKQKVETNTRTNEIEGVPSQQQKLDVMIRTIDVHIMSPKDLQYLAQKEVLGKTSIVCVGGKPMEGDSGEFLFMHVGDMAKVVGVGLDWAKVVVTKEFGVNVIQEDEGIWTKLWCLEHFVPRIITIPNPKQELVTHPNSTKIDGVELEANLGCMYVEDDKEENVHACFPLIFQLAEHIGLGRENAMKMKEVSGEGSSGSTKHGVNTRKQLKRKNVATSSGSSQETRKNEDEGSKDPSRDPPNPLDPSLSIGPQDEEERTLIVNVYPKAGELSITLCKGQQIPPSICPTLVFKFQWKGECKMIMSEATTPCDFGRMKNKAIKNGFNFYQDNITISLNCTDEDHDAARVIDPQVENVEYVKKTMVDTSTTINNAGHQFASQIGSVVMPHAIHNFPFHFQGSYGYTSSRGVNLALGSTREISFPQLDCFFVYDRSIPKELRFNFQYPQNILQEIALSDLSEIKTENTFGPTILGNWVNLNMNEESPYVFRVVRHIVSKKYLKTSLKHVGDPPRKHYEINFDRSTHTHVPIDEGSEVQPLTKQLYKVKLKVNHAMTHMPRKVKTILLSESNMIIKDVMEISPSTTKTT